MAAGAALPLALVARAGAEPVQTHLRVRQVPHQLLDQVRRDVKG